VLYVDVVIDEVLPMGLRQHFSKLNENREHGADRQAAALPGGLLKEC